MVAPGLRFRERVNRGFFLCRETKFGICIAQGHQRCLPAQFAVSVSAVMSVLEGQRTRDQFIKAGHGDLIEELLFVVVVKFLDHTVSPGFSHWDEPQLDSEMKAQADQGAHPAGISMTAGVGQFIVDLEVFRDTQPQPDGPEPVDNVLGILSGERFNATSACGDIDHILAVKPDRSSKKARPHKIRLMGLIRSARGQSWIGYPFGFIPTRPAMGQIIAGQDAVYGPL